MRSETYQMIARNGRPIRKATKVIFNDGYEVRFIERIPNRLAFPQAIAIRKNAETVSE